MRVSIVDKNINEINNKKNAILIYYSVELISHIQYIYIVQYSIYIYCPMSNIPCIEKKSRKN